MNLLHASQFLMLCSGCFTIGSAIVWGCCVAIRATRRDDLRLVTLISFACFVITGTIAAGMS